MRPKVSISCITYNQKRYIADAIESFLSQKTNFDYEIIIHDDASTDGTTEVIKKYESLYPDKVIGIYQTENQFSKGININPTFVYPKCRGEYIALCEGDDYWCDEYKLQKQVDYMDQHPECSFCFTNGYIYNTLNKTTRDFLPYEEKERDLASESRQMDLGENLQFSFIPTASFLFTHKAVLQLPEYFKKKCPKGDLKTRLFMIGRNRAYYLADKTVVYRENAVGSVMTSWFGYDKRHMYKHNESIVDMLNHLNEFTEYHYKQELQPLIDEHIKEMLLNASDLKILQDVQCHRVYKEMKLHDKFKFYAKLILPESLYHRKR